MSDPGFGQGGPAAGDGAARIDDETIRRLASAIGENVGRAVREAEADAARAGGPLAAQASMQRQLDDILDVLGEIRDAMQRPQQPGGE